MRAIYRPTGAALEYAPLACNLYTGCAHGCLYCYGPAIVHMDRATFHGWPHLRPGILEALREDAERMAGTTEPVLLCFTCDPYQSDSECDTRPTREAITILREHHIPIHVLTKGGLRATRDFDLLAGPGCAFGSTMVFSEESDREKWEPGAAALESRFNAIYIANSRWNLRTWVSLEPVIYPEQALWLIENLSFMVDEWRIGKLNHMDPPEPVDWHEWAPRLLKAVQDSGRDYLIKESLRPYLWEHSPTRRQGGVTCATATRPSVR